MAVSFLAPRECCQEGKHFIKFKKECVQFDTTVDGNDTVNDWQFQYLSIFSIGFVLKNQCLPVDNFDAFIAAI